MVSSIPNSHSRFYLPLIFFWGLLVIGRLDPAFSRSGIDFEPYLQPNDFMIIDSGGEIALDDLVLYANNGTDYVARAIGLPGDRIEYDLNGSSIRRNSQMVVTAPPGFQIGFSSSSVVRLGAEEYAVYVRDAPRAPVSVLVNGRDVRGTVDRIYRYSDLDWRDWLRIGVSTLLTVTLVCLPLIHFAHQRPNSSIRISLLVVHSVLVLIILVFVLAPLLPGNPLRISIDQPIWWWIPIAVAASISIEVLVLGGLLLAFWWFRTVARRGLSSL